MVFAVTNGTIYTPYESLRPSITMSRSVRDLRDLICVSRLQSRPSDDEIQLSDEEGRVSRAFAAAMSLVDPHHLTGMTQLNLQQPPVSNGDSRQSSAHSTRGPFNQRSPDSGFGTNGFSPESETVYAPVPPPDSKPSGARKKRKKKKHLQVSIGHELPRAAPLPPVRSISQTSVSPSLSSSDEVDTESTPIYSGRNTSPEQAPDNFDDILIYIDANLLSEWLTIANKQVSDLTQWCHRGDNYVQFAHFWLAQFPDRQRQDLIRMERDIIMDHMRVAFAVGRDQGKVTHQYLDNFCKAVFREYPRRLSRSMGAFLFLDHLDVLTSERTEAYKLLLTDVTCHTRMRQHAQWTLALRAFALASVWHGVVGFFRKLHTGPAGGLPIPVATIAKQNPQPQRMDQAIRHGFVDVVHYMLKTAKLSHDYRDSHSRTLVFIAVMHAQHDVLRYLTQQAQPWPDVNAAADTGNTPLHAAANNGDVTLVTTLLRCPRINLNPTNEQCEGATPLHLAVMHGHEHVVEVLLCAGANKHLKMGDLTVGMLANDFGHKAVLHVLDNY